MTSRAGLNTLVHLPTRVSKPPPGRGREPADDGLIPAIPYGRNRGYLGVSSESRVFSLPPRNPQIPLEVPRYTRLGTYARDINHPPPRPLKLAPALGPTDAHGETCTE